METFRLVSALEHGNLIEQEGERGKYHLGRGILRLAAATTARLELPVDHVHRDAEAMEHAIMLNGASAATNVQAFRRGRQVVCDPAVIAAYLGVDEDAS